MAWEGRGNGVVAMSVVGCAVEMCLGNAGLRARTSLCSTGSGLLATTSCLGWPWAGWRSGGLCPGLWGHPYSLPRSVLYIFHVRGPLHACWWPVVELGCPHASLPPWVLRVMAERGMWCSTCHPPARHFPKGLSRTFDACGSWSPHWVKAEVRADGGFSAVPLSWTQDREAASVTPREPGVLARGKNGAGRGGWSPGQREGQGGRGWGSGRREGGPLAGPSVGRQRSFDRGRTPGAQLVCLGGTGSWRRALLLPRVRARGWGVADHTGMMALSGTLPCSRVWVGGEGPHLPGRVTTLLGPR